MTAWWDR